jgi:hypothetical protein
MNIDTLLDAQQLLELLAGMQLQKPGEYGPLRLAKAAVDPGTWRCMHMDMLLDAQQLLEVFAGMQLQS